LLTFASTLAVPSIPSSSMVLVVTVLSSIGVPSDGAAILFAMEWLLDRCRSGTGGLTVMYAAATTDAICRRLKKGVDPDDELEGFDHEEDSQTITSNEGVV
uniref:Amino acid transporter n=2 Tax=Hymenolepis diminuta TaxID=6216 RepID=A0A0R3SMZ2_HYMDI